MSSAVQVQVNFLKSAAISALVLVALLFGCSNAFAKTITVNCPTVKAAVTPGYKISSDGYQWSSWQNQPRIEVSTANDKNYFAELSESKKGIQLRCIGGAEKTRYGFYTSVPNVMSCKLDKMTNKGFICEVKG